MDKIVAQVGYNPCLCKSFDDIQVGLKNNCTFCGVFRRQALDRGAMQVKYWELIQSIINKTNNVLTKYLNVDNLNDLVTQQILPLQLGVNKIVTGHNADDIAETVISNFEKTFFMFWVFGIHSACWMISQRQTSEDHDFE